MKIMSSYGGLTTVRKEGNIGSRRHINRTAFNATFGTVILLKWAREVHNYARWEFLCVLYKFRCTMNGLLSFQETSTINHITTT